MSDGSPWRSCADVILSRGDVGEDGDRSPPVFLIVGRDRKNRQGRTLLTQESVALW
jgi:hypothetical protein